MLSAVSVMGSGFVADRFGYRQTVDRQLRRHGERAWRCCSALTACPSAALLVLFVPVFGLCMGVRGPIVSSVCARYFAGPHVATIYGTIYSTNALGAAFGSLIGGAAARPHRRLPRRADGVALVFIAARRAAVLDRAGAAQLPLGSAIPRAAGWCGSASRSRWLSTRAEVREQLDRHRGRALGQGGEVLPR